MGFLNENITWAFCVFRTIAIRFVLNCGLSQEFWDCNCFFWLLLAFSTAEGGQSLQRSNIFAGLRWPTVETQSFWLILFNTKNKRRNGDSQDIIFVLLSGLILKICLCLHHCPKSGLKLFSRWFISLKFEDTNALGLNWIWIWKTWQRCCCNYLTTMLL